MQLGVVEDELLEPERAERSAIVGDDRHDRQDLPGLDIDVAQVAERVAEHGLEVSQREFDRVDGVELVRRRRHMERVLVLGPVVPAPRDPPRPARGGLELGEVQLPDLVGARGLLGERSLATLGELAPFALVLIRQNQAAVSQPAQNRRLRHDVPVVADHRPDLAVPPERMLPGVLVDQLGRSIAGRLRPRTLDERAARSWRNRKWLRCQPRDDRHRPRQAG